MRRHVVGRRRSAGMAVLQLQCSASAAERPSVCRVPSCEADCKIRCTLCQHSCKINQCSSTSAVPSAMQGKHAKQQLSDRARWEAAKPVIIV
jgi:hypothetical protein